MTIAKNISLERRKFLRALGAARRPSSEAADFFDLERTCAVLRAHSAGVAAIAFSSDGCGAVQVAGERLRPNRNAATIA